MRTVEYEKETDLQTGEIPVQEDAVLYSQPQIVFYSDIQFCINAVIREPYFEEYMVLFFVAFFRERTINSSTEQQKVHHSRDAKHSLKKSKIQEEKK